MKKFTLIIGLILFFFTIGISQNCPIINSIDYANDYETMPTATVKVNFHFLPINPVLANPNNPNAAHEYTMQEAQDLSTALVNYANQNFENLQHANSSTFYQSTPLPYVQKAKIKFELYDGGQGSVFIYSGPGKTYLNTFNHQTRYGQGNVLDIVISYVSGCANAPTRPNSFITLCNFDQVILSNTTAQQERARVLCHELGHFFALAHTFECGQCNSEINHTVECGGNCSCETPSNPSNNVMSYNQ